MIGVDEVGRGCLAGPLLVVAARQTGELPGGIKDSKVLTKKQRENFFYDIQLACDLGQGWVTSSEIDQWGLTKSMRVAVRRALTDLGATDDEEIIMDGNINYCAKKYSNAVCVIDADATHPIVSAASIYAKVLRDNHMAKLPPRYAKYNFEKHVGYGTKLHLEALKLHGVCDLHRLSFGPLKAYAK